MRKKSMRKLVVALFLFFTFFSAVLGGITARNSESVFKDKKIETIMGEEVLIGVNTDIEMRYEYSFCSHSFIEHRKALREEIGLNREEAKKYYSDFNIKLFLNDKLVLKKIFDRYCSEHYILELLGGELSVLRTKKYTDEQTEIRRIKNIDITELSREETADLKNGKVFQSMEDIDEYLTEISH